MLNTEHNFTTGAASMQTFLVFASRFNKSFKSKEEMQARFDNFAVSEARLNSFNSTTSKVGHNKFSDLSDDEFVQL